MCSGGSESTRKEQAVKKVLGLIAVTALLGFAVGYPYEGGSNFGSAHPALVFVAAGEQAPFNLTFEKSAVEEGIWEGRVSGDVEGDLRTELISADQSTPVWLVEFDWIISADDPEYSFVARLQGILNSETGLVIMSGEVSEGYRMGARVYEQGQLVDEETMTFEGVIHVVPAMTAAAH
jgi:hypothetical protein